MNSPKRTARLAGLLYLLGGLTGPFTLFAGLHLAINATNAIYQETVRAYLRITYPNFVTEGVTVENVIKRLLETLRPPIAL